VGVGFDRNTRYFRRVRIATDVAAASVAGGVGQADSLNSAWVIGRYFLLLDAHRKFRMPVVLAQAIRSITQQFAKLSFGQAHFPGPVNHSLGAAELQLGAALKVRLRYESFFVKFHRRGDRDACADCVDSQLVADVVGLYCGFQVQNAAGSGKCPNCLVLWAFAGEIFRFHLRDASAGDGASETGGLANQEITRQGFAGLLIAIFRFQVGFQEVSKWVRPSRVDDVDQQRRAMSGESFAGDRVGFDFVEGALGRFLQKFRVLGLHLARAAHDDRLQVLGAHDCPNSATARSAVLFVHDGREFGEALSRPRDAANPRRRLSDHFQKLVRRLV